MAEKDVKKGKEEEKDGVISAVYKVNMHCQQCAHQVEKPIRSIQGVQKVDIDLENNRITVKGKVDPKRIRERIEKTCDKKVELISILPKTKDEKATDKKGEEKKDTNKELPVNTAVIKVQMHCEKCEYDLKKKVLKFKGVHGVNTDLKSQTCTVEGTIDQHRLVEYIRKKAHKYAEVVPQKQEKKREEGKKEDGAKEGDAKKAEGRKGKEDEAKVKEEKKEELKVNDKAVPYIIHYVYAPQLFSDDNPNACSLM